MIKNSFVVTTILSDYTLLLKLSCTMILISEVKCIIRRERKLFSKLQTATFLRVL